MPKELLLPTNVVSDALNITTASSPRANAEGKFRIHVSDAIETTGPRAFCAREQVLAYHSPRVRTRGKLTPARELLFATGHFQHDYVIERLMRNSKYADYIYAQWTCRDYTWHDRDAHDMITTIWGKAKRIKCKCGQPLRVHNELDLELPSLLLVGHPDLVFLMPNDVYYVHENKTMERKDVSFDDLVNPLASHRLQISFYYKMLKHRAIKEGRNVSRKLVVNYIDRSNSKLFGGNPYKPLAIKPEADEYMRKYKNRLLHVVEGIKTKKLPPRICSEITCTRARNCDLATECFARRGMYVQKQVYNRGGLCAA